MLTSFLFLQTGSLKPSDYFQSPSCLIFKQCLFFPPLFLAFCPFCPLFQVNCSQLLPFHLSQEKIFFLRKKRGRENVLFLRKKSLSPPPGLKFSTSKIAKVFLSVAKRKRLWVVLSVYTFKIIMDLPVFLLRYLGYVHWQTLCSLACQSTCSYIVGGLACAA